jgi:hypothetical protein
MYNLHNTESWFNGGTAYHNDPDKTFCNSCAAHRPIDCDLHECDRVGRCMCDKTQCLCMR